MKQQVIRIKEEAGRCLLCHEPKCNEACPHGIDVGRIVRALNFENRVGARRRLPAVHYCENCDAPCMPQSSATARSRASKAPYAAGFTSLGAAPVSLCTEASETGKVK